MATNTPQPPSPNTDSRSAILLWLLAAAGITGAAASAIINIINKNPWQGIALAGLCLLALALIAFVAKVWQILADEWSKDTATWVNNLVQKKWFSYRSYYARFLTFQHRDFDVKGLSTQSIYTLE